MDDEILSTLHIDNSKRPMTCSLFSHTTQTARNNSLTTSDFWWTATSSNMLLVSKMQQAASFGRVQELCTILNEENLYLPLDIFHSSLLHCASRSNQLAVVQILIQRFEHDLNKGSLFDQCSSLHFALLRNHADVVFELVSHGAVVTEEDVKIACQWSCSKSLGVLFMCGALDKDMMTSAKIYCTEGSYEQSLDALRQMEDLSPVEYAAEVMHINALKMLAGRRHRLPQGNPTYLQFTRARIVLGKTRIRLLRPTKDVRECKEAIKAGLKRIAEFVHVFARFRVEGGLLVCSCPKLLIGLLECLHLRMSINS